MRFGFRVPSLKKRLAARTSWKRIVRHSMGFKAPRGMGFITNPKKAFYNAVYNRTTIGFNQMSRLKRQKQNKVTRSSGIHKDKYNIFGFSSLNDMLSHAIVRNISTNKLFICSRCGNDKWAAIRRWLLFWHADIIYCEICGMKTRYLYRNFIKKFINK